jgi:hypothetical protein
VIGTAGRVGRVSAAIEVVSRACTATVIRLSMAGKGSCKHRQVRACWAQQVVVWMQHCKLEQCTRVSAAPPGFWMH